MALYGHNYSSDVIVIVYIYIYVCVREIDKNDHRLYQLYLSKKLNTPPQTAKYRGDGRKRDGGRRPDTTKSFRAECSPVCLQRPCVHRTTMYAAPATSADGWWRWWGVVGERCGGNLSGLISFQLKRNAGRN